jgi:hypothetical protein
MDQRLIVMKALTILVARYGQSLVKFDPKAEARLRWKLDLYLLPTVAILYLFCFVDRANIGLYPLML